MIRRALFAIAITLGVSACTEKLTAPGTCPALCPGGDVDIRDTVLTAVPLGDSSVIGFQGRSDAVSLLLSDGAPYGQSRTVIRFARRGDSVLVRDTLRPFTIDSVALGVVLQRRDSTVGGLVLELYRLPRSIDTLSSVAAIDAEMTPASLLAEIPIADTDRSGELRVVLSPAAVAKLTFLPADTTKLQIGLRLRSNGGGAIQIGALNSGSSTPLFTTYVTANVADTTVRKQLLSRAPDLNFTARDDFGPPPPDLLEVGGFPAARSFIRFALPPFLRDSATILRATLELTLSTPLVAIPGDTARLDVRAVLVDFGAKSPVVFDRVLSTSLIPNMGATVQVDIVGLVQLWQGTNPLPSIIRLSIVQEGATFIAPLFESTRQGAPPRLRITYRPPFAFEGL
ncbi:MAG: hypothetical protein H0W15_04710 [Gemmatimonadales bacterium]|nr:hypothetical protein [Gemmatimonadales bacterium]